MQSQREENVRGRTQIPKKSAMRKGNDPAKLALVIGAQMEVTMKKLVMLLTAAALVASPLAAFAQDSGSAGTAKEQGQGANAKDKPASQNNTKPDSQH
jgi:hypothetical protein